MAKAIEVKARLVADDKPYVHGVKRAEAATNRFNRALKKSNVNPFGSIGKSAFRAAAGVASLYGAYNQSKKAVKATTDLAKGTAQLTRTTKLSNKEASAFVAITKIRGIDTLKVATSFTILSKQMVAATEGSESAASAFKELGVSQATLKTGNTTKAFMEAADGLSKMEVGATRNTMAARVFGRGYQAMYPLLLKGSAGIKEQMMIAEQLGATLDDTAMNSFGKFRQAQFDAQLAVMGLRVQLGTALLPTLTTLIGKLVQFIIGWREGTGAAGAFKDKLNEVVTAINTAMAPLTGSDSKVRNLAAAFGLLGGAIAGGKIAFSLVGIGSSLAVAFSNPVTATILAIVAAVALLGGAFVVLYNSSSQVRGLVSKVGQALKPIFKDVKAEWDKSLPAIKSAMRKLVSSIGTLFKELKPIIVPILKAIASVVKVNLRGLGPTIKFVADRMSDLANTVRVLRSAVSTMVNFAKGAFKTFKNAAVDAFNTAASPIRTLLDLLGRVKDLISNMPSPGGALSSLLAKIGGKGLQTLGQARAIDIAGAKPFGLGTEISNSQELADARLAAANVPKLRGAKTTKGKKAQADKNKRAQTRADNRVAQVEARQAAQLRKTEAKATLRTFLDGIVEQVKQARISQILSGAVDQAVGGRTLTGGARIDVTASREARSQREFIKSRGSLEGAISQGEKDIEDGKVKARLQQKNLAYEKRIAAARRAGNLDLVDQLTSEKEALNERYGPEYLVKLKDQLAQLNEDEIDRTSEAAAKLFADTVGANLTAALNELLNGGSVGQFFAKITALLAGTGAAPGAMPTGVTPGDVAAGGGAAGAGEAAAIIAPAKPLKQRITEWLKRRDAGTASKPKIYRASNIGQQLGATQSDVFKNRPTSLKGYKVENRASGGKLTPGAFTMVGETGPEMIVGGANVMSATRTKHLGAQGGMNITINASGAAANNPQLLARELGWQLATRQ